MAHTETQTFVSAPTRQMAGPMNILTTLFAALRTWQRAIASRKQLAELTPYQLRDIAHPEANRPVLDIKAGLITNLMSMR
ncbi:MULTISPECIES: DUF1127 domain-containing protein [Rhizobium]|uniref:DUF1127 domain-containing protein n=1 Tax=Rhizobium TaxID=379 RepID=UPI001B3338A1|nr:MULTISPECIES: DUF1127 domain-containing protein [Rhizobium]MBX4908228.1 DUF1127 domain-containing protein [Rhizobium bangladeshense]MBX5217112.1 DUF1127 domain-containing protein [Rhizobium sp. NLR9a]MBX5233443.1 DUF1127 domain-containing protein [Rhizobium sp. NLR4a]MBX5245487.1 DUF1127 domain-containing protein [Rhizobium sp. NLR3b]MBX5251083.1 DUF1127 domain-containing protein [Rhizobium sp. NLR4b]